MFVRGPERDVFPTCRRYGMGVIVWSPLNGGWLTGKYRTGTADGDSRFARLGGRGTWSVEAPGAARKAELLEELERIASDAGMDLITLAVAFTLAHPAVTSSIIGPRTLEQLESQLPAADVALDDEVLDRSTPSSARARRSAAPTVPTNPRRCATSANVGAAADRRPALRGYGTEPDRNLRNGPCGRRWPLTNLPLR